MVSNYHGESKSQINSALSKFTARGKENIFLKKYPVFHEIFSPLPLLKINTREIQESGIIYRQRQHISQSIEVYFFLEHCTRPSIVTYE